MAAALDILKEYWGYDRFRSPQEAIIDAVHSDSDVLALLPTGAGKSICYQVPALMAEGLCLVVSPLIALMKDQVGQLKRRGVKAAAIFSGLREPEIDGILNNCRVGHYKILYVSPERLGSDRFLIALRDLNVSLLAVDEAHCISQWGHDFRPSYREIAKVRALFPKIPVIALTASATPRVQEDIAQVLELKKGYQRFSSSFARPNISFAVRTEVSKSEKMLEVLQKVPGTAIVYSRNRRRTEDIAKFLAQHQISATYYHAGLSAADRNKRQDAWIKGEVRVMSCTNAFGMGIDKPDVRVVIHSDVPDSLEAYYQEAGRAGRDGKRSYAVLLNSQEDVKQLEEQVQQRFPELPEVRKIYNTLYNHLGIAFGGGKLSSFEFNLYLFARKYKWEVLLVFNALKLLEQAGYLQLSEAFALPSRVNIIMSTQDLYRFQVGHKELDEFIKVLLRTYEGLMGHFVKISELFLANKMGISAKEVAQKLQQLSKYQVLTYIPASDSPRITFLEERLPEDHIRLDHAYIAFSRQQMTDRITAMLDYAEAGPDSCRQRIMQAYFGEQDAKDCGKCDLCLRRKELQTLNDEEAIRRSILQKVANAGEEGLHLKTLTAPLGELLKEKYLFILRILLDEAQLCWLNEPKGILSLPANNRLSGDE